VLESGDALDMEKILLESENTPCVFHLR